MCEQKETIMIKSRNISFDLLRICAAIMVVMLHVSGQNWKIITPDRIEWVAMNFYDSMTRSAVPLFFMLTGAFMLKKDISLKHLYLKKIIPLSMIYICWSFLYAVEKIGIDRITTSAITEVIKFTVDSHYHLWYIPTLIGIYMLQPILRALVEYKEGYYVKYFLSIFVVFGVLRPTILLFIEKNTVLLTKIPLELMSYSGYVILGYFLTNMCKRKIKPWIMLVGFMAVVAIATIVCQIDALNLGKPNGILYGYFSLASFLEAMFLFICFKNLDLNCSAKMQTVLYYMSSLTFGTYLFHPFVLSQINSKFNINTLSYNTFIAIPVNAIVIVLICFFVTSIMIKIPIVRKFWKF